MPSLANPAIETNASSATRQVQRMCAQPTQVQSQSVGIHCIFLGLASVFHGLPWLFHEFFWLGWIGIACGLCLATRDTWVSSFWATWLWGSISIAIAFYWSPAAMAYTLGSGFGLGLAVATPLILWDGFRLAATYWLAARFTRDIRVVWLPAALVAILIEAFVPTVFPWRFGLMQLSFPFLLQAVDIFGASWTTLIAFTISGALLMLLARLARIQQSSGNSADALRTAPLAARSAAVACCSLLGFAIIYGSWMHSSIQSRIQSAERVRFGLVQVDPSYTWSLDKAQELTLSAAARADIICWPESSGGTYEVELTDLRDPEEVFMRSREPERGLRPWPSPTCELLLGGKTYRGDREVPDELYVTAMLINESELICKSYNKRFLMPFGEYVPGEETVPGLAALFDMSEHVQPGAEACAIRSSTGAEIGAMLCYEDMVPQASIDATKKGANVLVSLINGSAFESPHALSQHRLLAQLRSVECRKFLLRCSATGETCVISPLGEIVERIPMQQSGVLVADIALLPGQTIYTQTPWLSPFLATLVLVGFICSLKRKSLS